MSRRRTAGLRIGAILAVIFCLPVVTASAQAAEPGQSVACKSLTATSHSFKYSFTVTASASNGARISGYKFDFGDHQSYSFTFAKTAGGNRSTAKIDHTYIRPGTYQAAAFVITNEHGKMRYETSKGCKASVVVGQALPTELTNVGSGNTILVAAAAAIASGGVHDFALRRRLVAKHTV